MKNLSKLSEINSDTEQLPNKRGSIGSLSFSSGISNDGEEEDDEKPYVTASIPQLSLLPFDPTKPRARFFSFFFFFCHKFILNSKLVFFLENILVRRFIEYYS